MNIFEAIGNGIIKLITEVKNFVISLNVPAFIDQVKKKVLIGLSNGLKSYQTRISEKKRQETIGGSSSLRSQRPDHVSHVKSGNPFQVSVGEDLLSRGRRAASTSSTPTANAGLSLTTPSNPLAAAATQLTSRDGWDRIEVGRALNGLPHVLLRNTKNNTAKNMTLQQFKDYLRDLQRG